MASKKITLVAALLVALVAAVAATTYTTTTFEDEANPGQQQQCQRQLQGRQFRSCQRYLSQRSRGPYADDDEEILELATENPQQQPQHLRECCQQLQKVNEQCRCQAIRHAVRQLQQQQEGQQTGQSQQVYEKATDLPRRCNMRPQQCQIRVVFL